MENDITFGKITDNSSFFGEPVKEQLEIDDDTSKKDKDDVVDEKDDKKDEKKKNLQLKSEEDEGLSFAEEEEDDVVKDKKKEEEEDDIDYSILIQQLVDTGQWEEFELEEGVEIDNFTKEDFNQLAKQQSKQRRDKEKEDILSKLSDDEREFLEFKNKGGDLDTFIKTYTFKQQTSSLNIDTELGQQQTVYSYYKNIVGWNDTKIKKYLKSLMDDDELKEEAEQSKLKLEELAKKEHEKVLKEREDYYNRVEEATKQYKKSISQELKNLNIDAKESKLILKALVDKDDKGYTELDNSYLSLRNDPKKAKFLYDVLMNYDNFIKEISSKKINDENLKTFKKIKFNKKKKDSVEDDEISSRSNKELYLTVD